MLSHYSIHQHPPEPSWLERQQQKERLRTKLQEKNRAGFPAHFSYEQLGQFASHTVKPHEFPTKALSTIDHQLCFNHWPIANILKEADLLACESHLSKDCREVLKQFKILLHEYKKDDPLTLFSEAVAKVEWSKYGY